MTYAVSKMGQVVAIYRKKTLAIALNMSYYTHIDASPHAAKISDRGKRKNHEKHLY